MPANRVIDWKKPIRTMDGRSAQLIHICTCGRCDYPVKVFVTGHDGVIRESYVDVFGHHDRHGVRTGDDITNSDPAFMLEAEDLTARGKRGCKFE